MAKTKISRIPAIYRLPHGLPLYWRDESSGKLCEAVSAYLDHAVAGAPISAEQIELLRDYLEYYIRAPCWESSGFEAELRVLRAAASDLKSPRDIHGWLNQARDIGLDPL